MTTERIKVLARHLTTNPTGMTSSSPLTSHVLDTACGRPAEALPITLSVLNTASGQWVQITQSETNSDGRCPGLITNERFQPGVYKMNFNTGEYFKRTGTQGFYPYVDVVFTIQDPNQHYHVPLLLSPFGYSTYRGS